MAFNEECRAELAPPCIKHGLSRFRTSNFKVWTASVLDHILAWISVEPAAGLKAEPQCEFLSEFLSEMWRNQRSPTRDHLREDAINEWRISST